MNYQEIVESLMARCRQKDPSGLSGEKVEEQVISEVVQAGMEQVQPAEFIEWIKNHKVYSFYLYEVQQMGVCAKPQELAACVLEMILQDERRENSFEEISGPH